MTELGEIFSTEAIHASLSATSKRQALKRLAHWVSDTSGIDAGELCSAITERETLGSTGIGGGIAIPHVRMDGVEQIQCYFARLSEPVDYDAPDSKPVDLLFLLVAPENADSDHIRLVSKLARILRRDGVVEQLRHCRDLLGLQDVISSRQPIQSGAA